MAECNICLQAFEEAGECDRVPRVLACGHTLCQECILRLAQRAEHCSSFLLRCAECTHLSRFVSPQSLPRNIELLRLSQRQQSKPKIAVREGHIPAEEHGFFVLGNLGLFAGPGIQDCIFAAAKPDLGGLSYGYLRFISEITGEESSLSVSLLALGGSNTEGDGLTGLEHRKAVYTVAALKVWANLAQALKKELVILSRVASVSSWMCKVLGFWMSEHRQLYLVNRTFMGGRSLSKYIDKEEVDHQEVDHLCKSKVDAAVQLCEVLMELHGAGLCLGLFGTDVFVEDVFGRLYFHLNGALQLRRTMNRDGDICWQYFSPEMLEALSSSNGYPIVVDARSDTWSVALLLLQLFFKLPLRAVTFEQAYSGRFQPEPDVWKELEGSDVLLEQDLMELKQLLHKCIAYEVDERGSVHDIWESLRRLAFSTFKCGCSLPKPICSWSQETKVAWCIGLQDIDCIVLSNQVVSASPSHPDEDTPRGKLLKTFEGGHSDIITCLTFSGSYLVSTSYDKTVRVWTLQEGLQVWIWEGYHLQRILAAVSDVSRQVCYTGDYGGRICTWKVSAPFSSQPICSWKEHDDWRFSGVAALAVSSNGILYSGSGDRTIKAWSTEGEEYQHLATLHGHSSVVSALVIDGELLYSGSWDGSIRVWSLGDHSVVAVLKDEAAGVIRGLAVNADINMVTSFGDGTHAHVWQNYHFLGSRKVHDSVVSSMTLAQGLLVTGSSDFIHCWDIDEVLTENVGPVTSISLDTKQKDISFVTALAVHQGQLVAAISTQIKEFRL